jgi:hypothetical protein
MYRIMYNVFMYDVFLKCQSLSLSQSHLASRFSLLFSCFLFLFLTPYP